MIISVTERQTFQRCRQKWQWASFNREGLQPVIAKPALATGKLWHRIHAEWSLHQEQDPTYIAKTMCLEDIDRVTADYYSLVGAPISDLELNPIYDQMGLVMSMVENYVARWQAPMPDGFTMVSPEQTIVVPVPTLEDIECPFCKGTGGFSDPMGIECLECKGTGRTKVELEATLDGLLRDDFGRVYVLERKTYGQRPKPEVLAMQDQFLAYLWVLDNLQLGELGGMAYDGAWKRKDVPNKGKSNAGTLEDLFLRLRLTRNAHERERFATVHLPGIAMDMLNNPAIYINRRYDGCWDCDFVEPCIAQERGDDYVFILKHKYIPRPRDEDNALSLKHAEED